MLEIDPKSRLPIYEQIMEGIAKQVLLGILPADEQIPSVRAMAMQLAVNPNTVQKAYQALEENGIIYSVPGKGSFASPKARLSEEMSRHLLSRLETLLREAALMGLPLEQVQETVGRVYRSFSYSKEGSTDD